MVFSRGKKLLLVLTITYVFYYSFHSSLNEKIEELLKWYEKYSITSRIEANDPDFVNSEMARNFSDKGFHWNETGKYEEALESYKYSLSIQRKLHSNEQLKVITDLVKIIGELCVRVEKYNEAIVYFNQLLKTQRKKFGDDINKHVAEAMLLIADTYYSMKNFSEASHFYKETKSIYERLNFEHSDKRYNGKLMEIEQVLVLSDMFKKSNDNNRSANNQEL